MSALIKLLGPMQAKILAAGAAGGAAVGTWQWQQARQALQSSGKSFDEIFDAADKDKNGTVDGLELQHALRQAGHPTTQEQMRILMGSADKNKDGVLTREEFRVAMLGK